MTTHRIIVGNSNDMAEIADRSVNLIVTSPPYPMIEMWDSMFAAQDSSIGDALIAGNGMDAFEKMQKLLDGVWAECDRVLADNCFICINIGDATRTINGEFQLYSNHTRVINYFLSKGYSVMPDIHWRKQSNAPNKFMGSGMYPAGAYVTYEHEYILIFRKGGKREFKGEEKALRQKSAYFWEERNVWFSDLWDIKGITQAIAAPKTVRSRNASYPLEIPYRLVNMYSAEGDTVLDPFAGLGTTNIACMIAKRNSIGIEVDPEIAEMALEQMNQSTITLNSVVEDRIRRHLDFLANLSIVKKAQCYDNVPHGFKVKTKQEIALQLDEVAKIKRRESTYYCEYQKWRMKDEQLSML